MTLELFLRIIDHYIEENSYTCNASASTYPLNSKFIMLKHANYHYHFQP